MRSVTDAMYTPAIAVDLRSRSHECVAAQADEELRVMGDPELWSWAQIHRRAVVTENAKDFVPLATASGDRHFGLILTHNSSFPRHKPHHVGAIAAALDRLHLERPGDDASGWVHWLRP